MDRLLAEHGDAILSLIAGLVGGSLITLRLTNKRSGGNFVDQSRAKAGGDIVGGSKSSKSDGGKTS